MGNGNVQRIKILLSSLMAVIAAMADIYVIVNAPKNYILLGVISLILLVAVYLVISGKMQLKDLNNLKREEEYSNLVNSQKACYLQVRKGFRETSGRISELDKKVAPLAKAGEVNHQKISGLLDSLMQDQKKVAKLTVSRSKENATAMMNSNDKVIEEMFKMQEAMNDIFGQMGNQTDNGQSEEFSRVEEGQQELLAKMSQLEDSLKIQIETVADKFQQMPEINARPVIEEEPKPMMEEPIMEEPVMEELIIEEPAIEEEPIIEEPVIEEPILEEEPVMEEPIVEEPVIDDISIDDIGIEEPEIDDTAIDDIGIEEPAAEELLVDDTAIDDTAIDDIGMEEPIIEEPIMEEPIAEEPSKADDGMLSPEEIAALIAGSMEEEPLPEVIEEPEEEIPAMPDLSDPNRKMSPEDIAALIANM